jgi:hypothetical protein
MAMLHVDADQLAHAGFRCDTIKGGRMYKIRFMGSDSGFMT